MNITLYSVLQVAEDADAEIILASYKALSKKYHPDNHVSGDAKRFTQIAQAYEILSDPERRREYDQRRQNAQSSPIGVNSPFTSPKAIVTVKRLDGTDTWCTIDEHIKRKGMELEATCLDHLILRNIQLPSANLSRCRLNGVIFENVSLVDANLAEVSAIKATFKGVQFERTDLHASHFTDCDFRGSSFTTMQLKNCGFIRCLFDDVSFVLCDEGNSFFAEDSAAIRNCSFVSCSMQSVKWGDPASRNGQRFLNVDFSGANLTNALFCNSEIVECCFEQTLLLGANFHKASLENLDLSTCNLVNARFHESNLSSVKFPPGFSLPEPAKVCPSRQANVSLDLGNKQILKLIWCPAGRFLMGSPNTEAGRSYDETQHRVVLATGFWIGQYPVTQGQFETIMGENPSHNKKNKIMGLFGGETQPNHPVDSVLFHDVTRFVERLNTLFPHLSFALPTEAQWEYACRAGTTTEYYFGDSAANLKEYAWFFENTRATMPVGLKKPNPAGLYDMLGNVYERCRDGYAPYPTTEVVDQVLETNEWNGCSCRGGGLDSLAENCRCASRSYWRCISEWQLGFRIIATPC